MIQGEVLPFGVIQGHRFWYKSKVRVAYIFLAFAMPIVHYFDARLLISHSVTQAVTLHFIIQS